MHELINVLTSLSVLDDLKSSFSANNIEFNEINLKAASIGFDKITESLSSSMLVLNESVVNFISHMREKQETEFLEQGFALLGIMQQGSDGKTIGYINEYIEDDISDSRADSVVGGEEFYQKINTYLNDKSIPNKFLIMGHTHPDLEKLSKGQDFIDEREDIRMAIESLTGNPLRLRERGFNPSIGDIHSLIIGQNAISPVQLLMGIALPNSEFNVLHYNGTTIKSLDNIFVIRDNKLEPLPTFRTYSSIRNNNK